MKRTQGKHRIARGMIIMLLALLCFFCISAVSLVWPSADGTGVLTKNGTTIDMSHKEDGYIMVQQQPSSKRYKLRVVKDNTTYTYDLDNTGEWVVYPLQLGTGKYTVTVYRQQSGTQYSTQSSQSFSVDSFNIDNACFLCPNQYVSYTADSEVVSVSDSVCAGLTSDSDKISAVSSYILKRIKYDYIEALTVQKGYLPDVDEVLDTGKGICFDYAALCAAMLRLQGIPTQLVIGYADNAYHSWNLVYVDGDWKRIDLTAESTANKVMKYTTERFY